MAVGNIDVAIGRDGYIAGKIEGVSPRTGNARLAERHENFSFGTELEYLMTLAGFAARVGYPEIAVGIYGCAVGKHEHVCSEGGEQFAVAIEFENRRLAPVFTR